MQVKTKAQNSADSALGTRNRAVLGQLSDMDLRLLKVFKSVVDCGGMAAAELELNIGTSTVSRHVKDLETRLAEALPWVLLTYPDLDWAWLISQAKLRDAQNRLGFLVAVAKVLAASRPELQPAVAQLVVVEQQLERARLVREDTLCRDSMPAAERRWLETNRSPLARHWNLLTGLAADQLAYAS